MFEGEDKGFDSNGPLDACSCRASDELVYPAFCMGHAHGERCVGLECFPMKVGLGVELVTFLFADTHSKITMLTFSYIYKMSRHAS